MDYWSTSSFCNIQHTEQDYGIGGASSIVDVLGNDAKANLQESLISKSIISRKWRGHDHPDSSLRWRYWY